VWRLNLGDLRLSLKMKKSVFLFVVNLRPGVRNLRLSVRTFELRPDAFCEAESVGSLETSGRSVDMA